MQVFFTALFSFLQLTLASLQSNSFLSEPNHIYLMPEYSANMRAFSSLNKNNLSVTIELVDHYIHSLNTAINSLTFMRLSEAWLIERWTLIRFNFATL